MSDTSAADGSELIGTVAQTMHELQRQLVQTGMEMKEDAVAAAGDIEAVKGELSQVRGELKEVKGELSGVRGEMSEIRAFSENV